MKMIFFSPVLFFVLLCVVFFGSCKKNSATEINAEQEFITTLKFILVNTSNIKDTVKMIFRDMDGDGGNAPIVEVSKNLSINTTYDGSIILLNESLSPVEDITEEVKELKHEHQFFYNIYNLNLQASYNDADDDGKPVGLVMRVQAGSESLGKLKITLRHQPNKSASNVSTGDMTNAGGETDIEVEFDVKIS